MCKRVVLFLWLLLAFFESLGTPDTRGEKSLKVLHISFHKGCVNDFAEVAQELGLELTSWYVFESDDFRNFFDETSQGNEIYNISHVRAQTIYENHKDFFETFDVIVTSDTAPLSRIFLQHAWKKPLIIWVCNRFDYCDGRPNCSVFPDLEYYDLFRQAVHMPHVKIISYTPYEYHHARGRGVDIGTFTIRPLGTKEKELDALFVSKIPESVEKESTLFLFPRLENHHIEHIQEQCNQVGIKTYCGSYNGPEDLRAFKGILYIPYAWSNLALFENIQRGYVHFVPSEEFMRNVIEQKLPIRAFTDGNFDLCDWYCDEYRDLFVYFDSWQDLKEKVVSTDYGALSCKVKAAGIVHRQEMLRKWQCVFDDLRITLKINR